MKAPRPPEANERPRQPHSQTPQMRQSPASEPQERAQTPEAKRYRSKNERKPTTSAGQTEKLRSAEPGGRVAGPQKATEICDAERSYPDERLCKRAHQGFQFHSPARPPIKPP